MGVANAQRALNYIRIFGEFFAQQEYSSLIGIFGIMNEPLQSVIGKSSLTSLCVLRSLFPNSLITAANATRHPAVQLHPGSQHAPRDHWGW
jgi:glucan 1,3-beta-glucosidase